MKVNGAGMARGGPPSRSRPYKTGVQVHELRVSKLMKFAQMQLYLLKANRRIDSLAVGLTTLWSKICTQCPTNRRSESLIAEEKHNVEIPPLPVHSSYGLPYKISTLQIRWSFSHRKLAKNLKIRPFRVQTVYKLMVYT